MIRPLIALLLVLPATGAWSRTVVNHLASAPSTQEPRTPGEMCSAAVEAAEREAATPSGLLSAIGRVESGRADRSGYVRPWPWAINYGGTGAYFETKEQAISAVQTLQAQGVRSIDV